MNASELRDLSSEELEAKSNELRMELFNMKVKHSTGQLEDTARLAHLRRDVARCETLLRERQEATAE